MKPSPIRWLCLGLFVAAAAASGSEADLEHGRELFRAGDAEGALAQFESIVIDPAASVEDGARAQNNVCFVLNALGRYRDAEPECRRAVELRRALGGDQSLARVLNNLATVEEHLGEIDRAAGRYAEALAINERLGDQEAVVINLINLGVLATDAGRYGEAQSLYDRATARIGTHPAEPWVDRQKDVVALNRGVLFERSAAFAEAREVYVELLQTDRLTDSRGRAALLLNLGVVLRNLGDVAGARRAYDESMRLYESVDDAAETANVMQNVGILLDENEGDPTAAAEALRLSVELFRRAGESREEAESLYLLGKLALGRDEIEPAERAFNRALELATEVSSPSGAASASVGLARLELAQGEPKRALSHLVSAMQQIDGIGSRVSVGLLRDSFFASYREVYEAAIELLWSSPQVSDDPARQSLDIALRAKERALLARLASRSAAPSAPETDTVLDRLGERVLIEYFVGEENVYRWQLRDGATRFARLGSTADLRRRVESLYGDLSVQRRPAEASVSELAESLLGDLDLDSPGPLLVAPDRFLRLIPFELLTARRSGDGSIAYLPSAAALVEVPLAGTSPYSLLGFASAGGAVADSWLSRALEPLPGSAAEVQRAAELVPGPHRLFTGGEATVAEFRRRAAEGARVVHVASHTVVDEGPRAETAIVFAGGTMGESLLRPSDLAPGSLNVALTVLAACRSGAPTQAEGSALNTLTGALLAAGSGAVIATLWDVDDAATSVLMEQFYYQLGRGLTPAASLARAKQRMREDPRWDRPSVWAAFILVGDIGPLFPPSPRPALFFLLATLALIGVGVAAWIARLRSR